MEASVHSWVVYCVLIAMVVTAAIFDYKHHRIPNWLSFSGWYLGPALHLITAGLPALTDSILGLLIVLLFSFPLFVVKWFGAGDVKLLASVAALAGYEHMSLFVGSIVITGFVVGVIQLMMRGNLGAFAKRCWVMLGLSMANNRPVYMDYGCSKVVMPYAVSIAIGTLVAISLL